MTAATPEHWYFVVHGRTGQCCDVLASSPEAAGKSRGWAPSDCVVVQIGRVNPKGWHAFMAAESPSRPRGGLAARARLV